MGLLSDPSLAPRNKLGLYLAKHTRKICFFFYIAGLIGFVGLSHTDFNHSTYLSENALSPGLVYPEIRIESNRLAVNLNEELLREHKQHKSTTPHAWIAAKMRRYGLETHVHNFTLRSPFIKGKDYHGKNVYGILRAPRIGSTEGIVFSAPYRPPNSVHTDISASVPVLLAFAEFARSKNFWAKDLIFLVTEQEQLGMQAWLDAYHEGDIESGSNNILHHGNLIGRAGALQAALNLEIQDLEIDYLNVKVEGLNGKLPNLDMFNLVQRITSREGLTSGYKYNPRKPRRSSIAAMEQNLYNMVTMLLNQASGVPSGNHGLFLRYRIEALTIEAIKRVTKNKTGRNSAAMPLLKTIEGISRSLNNLLERFHQSFFFYIIVHNDRYISIGDYMPCLVILAACLFIKAFLTWVSLCDNNGFAIEEENDKNSGDLNSSKSDCNVDDLCKAQEDTEIVSKISNYNSNSTVIMQVTNGFDDVVMDFKLPYITIILYVCLFFSIGYLCNSLPSHPYAIDLPLSSSTIITATLVAVTILGLTVPYAIILPVGGLELLHVGFLLFHGVTLIIIGLLNFALSIFTAIISVPLAILLDTNVACSLTLRTFMQIYTILLNPLILIYVIVFVMAFQQFPDLTVQELFARAFTATMDVVTFGYVDSLIYGNWLYIAATFVFLPSWMTCWTLAVSRRHLKVTKKVKMN